VELPKAEKVDSRGSSRAAKTSLPTGVTLSEPVKLKIALVWVMVPEGPPVMVVCGGVVSSPCCSSIVKLRGAGLGSWLPASSRALTRKV